MYLCEHCHQQISANTSAYFYPIKLRHKVYPKRSKVNQHHLNNHVKFTDDEGGNGFEFVKVLRVCPDCYQHLNQTSYS